jgi:hypothetical protein
LVAKSIGAISGHGAKKTTAVLVGKPFPESWTDEQIEQYRAHHPMGTMARLRSGVRPDRSVLLT